ncbi:MAG TPA: IscS subfamily cysteine desulfurase [Candidatus Latescibacteria bacterium]|nr:IscS subfamily cysteine desulfurase [Candidatus Latescibacterota bacterium]|tara:strand:+ start:569 stop:1729 length:1161 start_codon:yes stop_codon:yes gene_type:complete
MSPQTPIYVDNHATTPVDERVLQDMLPFLTDHFGNAASRTHSYGWKAESAVDRAREQVADLISAQPKDIVFTSGATESDNLAVKGVANARGGGHIITQVTEHHAVLDSCRALEQKGFRITYLSVDSNGRLDPEAVETAIADDTILVSVMSANNEIGVLQPIEEIGWLCKSRNVLFHTDATQSVGKLPLDVEASGIDLLSITAHKMYGPKGVGALYVRSRPRVGLVAEIDGGGHERSMRSGTLNVSGIVGLGRACELSGEVMASEHTRVGDLRNRLKEQIFANLDNVFLNGHPTERLYGNLNVSISNADSESLLMRLGDVALSSGSACTSAALEPSYVLKALGLSNHLAQNSVRFGLGRFNTEEEVDYVARRVVEEVGRLREISPTS